jgi:hypothetical protein
VPPPPRWRQRNIWPTTSTKPRSWIVPCLEGGSPTRTSGSSIYPAVQNMLLAARALGLGATLTTLYTCSSRRHPLKKPLPAGCQEPVHQTDTVGRPVHPRPAWVAAAARCDRYDFAIRVEFKEGLPVTRMEKLARSTTRHVQLRIGRAEPPSHDTLRLSRLSNASARYA